MPKYNKQLMLEGLMSDLAELIEATKGLLALEDSILNHKPAPKKWSAYECVEHLNVSHKVYIDQLKLVVANPKYVRQSETFSAGFFGEQMVNTLKPSATGEIKMPMPTFDKADPAKLKSELSKEVIQRFLVQLQELSIILEKSTAVDWEKTRITSLIGKILRFKFGDALRFVIAHNQRHILQAQKAIHNNINAVD